MTAGAGKRGPRGSGTVRERKQRPKTVEQLWEEGWVAEDEDEAVRQAERMFDLFTGRPVRVDRLLFLHDDDYDEEMFVKPWPRVVPYALDVDRGWDGDVLYPEWYVRPTNLRQVLTTHEGRRFRMADIWRENEGQLVTTAPGVGTAEGFSHKDLLIYPAPVEPPGGLAWWHGGEPGDEPASA